MSAYGGVAGERGAVGDSRPAMLAAVRARLIAMGVPPTPAQVASALRAEGGPLGDDELLAEAKRLGADLTGAGPLQPLLELHGVTDVLVNGPDEVWIDGGRGLARVAMTLDGEPAVRGLAQRLAAAAGRRLDDACPYVDARLPDGTRLHAVLPPVAPDGTHLSLRLPRRRAFGLDELVAAGGVPPLGARILRGLVAARVAFLVTGGTGTGKTTWLAALLSLVDPAERIVLVEDSAELWPDHAHTVRLQTRTANVEGAGGVPMHELVRQALRMRPDRLVVGEVRGAEVVEPNVKHLRILRDVMVTPRNPAIYCRLSYAPDGSLEKVERQEADCRQLAARLGWPVSDRFISRTTRGLRGSVTANAPPGTGCWRRSSPARSTASSSGTATG